MNILSFFRRGAAQPNSPTAIRLSYRDLQNFFQIFTMGFIDAPESDHRSVTVPGTILRAQKLPEAEIFFDENLGKVDTSSEHINQQGDHLYIGQFVTHGQSTALEYLYIIMAKGGMQDAKGLARLDPHFVFLGTIIRGELNEADMVEVIHLLTKSDWDGQSAGYTLNDIHNPEDVIQAFVYGDHLMRAIYGNIPIQNDMLAADVDALDPIIRHQKFCYLADHRKPDLFRAELAELRADYATNGFTIPALKLERT